jgi:iron complex outermembrane receptor protein
LNEHRINKYITPDSIELSFNDRLIENYTDNLTTYFIGKFETGKINHQVLLGYDYINYRFQSIEQKARGAADGLENFSLNNPKHYKRPIHNYLLKPSAYNNLNYYYTQGAYIQEQLQWGKFQALLALRQEYYTVPSKDVSIDSYNKNDNQSALLPRIGLLYGVTNNINIYATYLQGYEPQNAATNLNPNAGGPFDPLTSNLVEGGAKGEFFSKRLFAGIALYQIEMSNVLVSANDPANPDLLVQRGQERAQGAELEAAGQIFPNLSILLSYAYNNTKITKSSAETPELLGLVKENAPLHNTGSWIKYTINSGKLNGLGFGIGHSYNSSRRTFAKYPNSEEYLMLPEYMVINSAIYYSVNKLILSVNVNNITDKKHFIGGYNFERNFPGAPRNYLVSIGYKF